MFLKWYSSTFWIDCLWKFAQIFSTCQICITQELSFYNLFQFTVIKLSENVKTNTSTFQSQLKWFEFSDDTIVKMSL